MIKVYPALRFDPAAVDLARSDDGLKSKPEMGKREGRIRHQRTIRQFTLYYEMMPDVDKRILETFACDVGIAEGFYYQEYDQGGLFHNVRGMWQMDEASWNGTVDEVEDVSGYGFHGTSYDNATTDPGKVGRCGIFNLPDSPRVKIPDVMAQIGSAFSIAAWIKPNASISASNPVAFGSLDQGHYFMKGLGLRGAANGSSWDVYVGDGYQEAKVSLGDLRGAWHHVSIVYDGRLRVYLDGALEADTPIASFQRADDHLYVAWNNFLSDKQFEGYIDELSLWGRTITDAEAAVLYNGGSAYDWEPTLTIYQVRFKEMPKFQYISHNNWSAVVSMEVI